MFRHSLGVVFLATCLSTLPAPASAALIEIDFEGFSDFEALSQIGDVSFTNAVVLTAGAIGGSLNDFDFPPHSGTNVIFDGGTGPMTINFLNPIESFQSFVTHLGDLTVSYFGVGGTLLGQSTSTTPSLGGHEAFSSLALTGISSVAITSGLGLGAFTLDDLSFNTIDGTEPIPEPSTLLLVGTGVAALVRRRYKQRNARA